MIRVLFMIVAAVAAILGFVLKWPLLFVASGVALAVSVALILQRVQRRRASHQKVSSAYAQKQSTDDDELNALGILDIKPRDRSMQSDADETSPRDTAAPSAADRASIEREKDSVENVATKKGVSASGSAESNGIRPRNRPQTTLAVKERSQTIRASMDEDSDGSKDVLLPYLQSLRAVLGAQTVCLLKQDEKSLHYHIEGVVSLNAYARSGGDFATRVPLIQTRDSKSATCIRRISEDDLPPGNLGYYRETIAVKQLAVAAVPRPSAPSTYFLLADSMQEGALDTPRQRALLSHFARLLGAIIEPGDQAETLDVYDYVRPRREIILEEIEQARSKELPLALALIHLNDAELIARQGDGDIKEAERALASQLRYTARDARVERFGELTYGVFFHADGPAVEGWAVDLQHGLTETPGPLQGGVSIGIAFLQDRHRDADAFRQDATDALREAFDTGMCTIVE